MLLVALLSLAALAADPPVIPTGFVLRPTFHTTAGDQRAGTAFGLDIDGTYYVATVFHLFGPPGGLAAQVPATDLPAYVTSVTVVEPWTGALVGEAKPPLPLPDAKPMADTAAFDLVVFPIDRPPPVDALSISGKTVIHPLKLATALPRVGDPVWLVVQLINEPDAPHTVAAKVVEVNPDWLFYQFERSDLDLTATSGGPVVDATGAVVGVHVGAGKMDNDLIGSANPLPAHRDRITKAAGK